MRKPSFARNLFFGLIEESLIFPWPDSGAADAGRLHALLDALRRFFEDHVDSAEIDRSERIPSGVLAKLKQLGCFGLAVPTRDGGLGLSCTATSRVMQEIAGFDSAVAVTVGAHHSLAVRALSLFGTDAQKKRYLSSLAEGQRIAAFALAESGAGSDAGGIRTRAEREADGSYLLSGTKAWTTNGALADFFVVFARTSPAEEGTKPKITAFLVERGPGLGNGPNERKLGVRGSSTTALHFEGVRVAAENVLGEPGHGFKIAMQVLDGARLDLASSCVGVCKRAIKMAVERCRGRRAFGRPIGEFGLIKDKIAAMMSETWALECVTYLTTGMVDSGADDFSIESAICKIYGSETCWRVVNEAMQIAAGAGFMADSPAERLLRDARVYMVFEGTNEILRAFVALSGIEGPARERADVVRAMHEPIKGFGLLSEVAMRKARGALGRQRPTRHHPILQREAGILETYAQELARGVDNVLRKHGRDVTEMQYTQKRTADMAIALYAVAACITRTTRVIERRGEEGARREIDLTRIFVATAARRLRETIESSDDNDDELRKSVATRAYADGSYPFDIF